MLLLLLLLFSLFSLFDCFSGGGGGGCLNDFDETAYVFMIGVEGNEIYSLSVCTDEFAVILFFL